MLEETVSLERTVVRVRLQNAPMTMFHDPKRIIVSLDILQATLIDKKDVPVKIEESILTLTRIYPRKR